MKNAFSKMESKSNLTDFEDTPKPSTQSNSAGGKSTSSSSTSSVAASTGGVGSGWRQFSYKATVNCTGVATGGNKVAIKKPNTLVSCFETITPNGALVRVSTANLAEVLKDLPSSYGKKTEPG